MAENYDEMSEKELERARNSANNTENIRNAADVAVASGNAYAVAAGKAVKTADKVTGGKATEALGKGMTRLNEHAPGGKRIQNTSNKLSESGASNKIGDAARIKNKFGSGTGSTTDKDTAEKINGVGEHSGGGQNASLPSSVADKDKNTKDNKVADKSGPAKDSSLDKNDETGDSKKGIGAFLAKHIVVSIMLFFLPIILIIILFIMIIASVTGVITEYQDAFGMSQLLGDETGGLYFTASSPEQEAFYERVKNVKLAYQAQGKSVDPYKIVALYHVLTSNGVDLDYKDVSEWTIRGWADAMFSENVYDEDVFKNNMINSIFPKYLPSTSVAQREEYADEVLRYMDNYNNLIGKNQSSGSCASIGSCSYDIKGFYIPGSGNISKNLQISDLKVRLMQCGSPFGNGSYSTPINQPLVDFEDYVAGVAYAEVGEGAPEEQYKAQMVAARSFALSRPTAMGNSLGKKLEQENGQWILQISSCVADQVFCNIDEGCHGTGGSQGGYVVNGDDSSAWFRKAALPEDHTIRKAAAATQGEVLVNAQGNIIATGFLATEQNLWRSLANSGLNYKQILLQTYNQGSRNYGATDIKKASCNSSGGGVCASNGEYSGWRQYDSQWGSVPMGDSGQTIQQIGCLVTSISIQIAKSGVETSVNPFNPGTFVEFLNKNGGFARGGNFVWASATKAAPKFAYQGQVYVSGMSRDQKLNKIKELSSQQGVYVVAEVKGNTGQHWVAVDGVNGSTVNMIDPASDSTDMWSQYNWANTSTLAYYKVG